MDASEAGEGSLEILVSSLETSTGEEMNTPTRVEPMGSARFQVSYVPQMEGRHNIFITFNDEPVHGNSPVKIDFKHILIFFFR